MEFKFEKFYEEVSGQLPFTPKTIKRGLGIDVPKSMWSRIQSHKPIFGNDVSVKQHNVWSDCIDANEEFIRKTFSIAAVALGFGKAYKLPKTTLEVFFPKRKGVNEFDYSGAFQVVGDTQTIEINLEDIFYHDGIIQRYFWILLHELAHTRQVVMDRMDNGKRYSWNDQPEKATDMSISEYESRPVEADANEVTKRTLKLLLQYLRTGTYGRKRR
jgi:hypothetical protein